MSINAGNFDSVFKIFDSTEIYCVPTFQRPFAWEVKQVEDVIRDIHSASSRKKPYHYLSPIHLVDIKSPDDSIWKNYIDNENEDINILTKNQFKDTNRNPWNVHLVIDGQQRLTVLYVILYLLSNNGEGLTANFGPEKLPKIILNPAADHCFFKKMLQIPSGSMSGLTSSKSQDRLKSLFVKLGEQPFSVEHQDFIRSRYFQSLLVSLFPDYALGTFLTLNDRGKILTTFEKLKSFFMDCDFNHPDPKRLPSDIHKVFGDAYKFLDHKNCIVDEEQFVQLSAINVWAAAPDVTSSGASALYEMFRKHSEEAQDVSGELHNNWLPKFSEISAQIEYLNRYLDGSGPEAGLDSNICPCRKVGDDYKIILQSLKLSIRSLAVLLKFRQAFGCELHRICGTVKFSNSGLKDRLKREIETIYVDLKQVHSTSQLLLDKAKTILKRISLLDAESSREVSPLLLAEMMELTVFKLRSIKPGNYATAWDLSFLRSAKTLPDAAQQWANFISVYSGREKLLDHLFEACDVRDAQFRHVLLEQESFSGRRNVYFLELDLEHIFPQNKDGIGPIISSYGFSNDEYQEFVETLGNKVFLHSGLNRAIKDQLPDVKAGAYKDQRYGHTVAPVEKQTQSSIKTGKVLSGLKAEQFKYYLRLRRMEIVLFALKRFF